MRINGSFEDQYKGSKNFWGNDVSLTLSDNIHWLVPGSVLDLGAGDGKNAVFLARKGFAVTALDISSSGLANLREKARAAGVTVQTIEADLRDFKVAEQYDNVVTNFVLHLLGEEYIIPTLHKMAEGTAPGGVNFIESFTQNGPLATSHPENFVTEASLIDFYKKLGWEIVAKDLRLVGTIKKDASGKPMRHQAITLIAKKPLDY